MDKNFLKCICARKCENPLGSIISVRCKLGFWIEQIVLPIGNFFHHLKTSIKIDNFFNPFDKRRIVFRKDNKSISLGEVVNHVYFHVVLIISCDLAKILLF